MAMALNRWWRIREGASGGAGPAERAESRDRRHDLANVQHQIAMQTQVLKNAADAIEDAIAAHVKYVQTSAKDWTPHDDDASDCDRGGDAQRPPDGGVPL